MPRRAANQAPPRRRWIAAAAGWLTAWAVAAPAAAGSAEPRGLAAAPSLQALIQRQGVPLAGGRIQGEARLQLERASGGDTPVLTFQAPAPAGGAPMPVRLLLDTGAAATMITPELAARLGLTTTPLPRGAFGLAGGGAGCADLLPRRARLPDLRLRTLPGWDGSPAAELLLQGVETLVLPVAALPRGVEGVLGAPSLRLLPILIDPAGSRLILGPNAPWAMASPPATGRSQPAVAPPLRVPLRWRQGVPLLNLPSGRGPVQALADTGAEGLFISPSLATRLKPAGPAQRLRLVGVCGEQSVRRQPFIGLSLPGAAPAAGPVEAIVTHNPVFAALGVEAIAGQEWLRRHTQLWRLDLEPPELLLR